jgi:hypothetical protein
MKWLLIIAACVSIAEAKVSPRTFVRAQCIVRCGFNASSRTIRLCQRDPTACGNPCEDACEELCEQGTTTTTTVSCTTTTLPHCPFAP